MAGAEKERAKLLKALGLGEGRGVDGARLEQILDEYIPVLSDFDGNLTAPVLDRYASRLGVRLVSDWDTATTSGKYYSASGGTNVPESGTYFGEVVSNTNDANGSHVLQVIHGYANHDAESGADTRSWRRIRWGGTWLPWVRLRSSQPELDKRYANGILPGQGITIPPNDGTNYVTNNSRILTFAGGYTLNLNVSAHELVPAYTGVLMILPVGLRPVTTIFSGELSQPADTRVDIQPNGAVNPQRDIPLNITLRGQVIVSGPLQ